MKFLYKLKHSLAFFRKYNDAATASMLQKGDFIIMLHHHSPGWAYVFCKYGHGCTWSTAFYQNDTVESYQ